MFIFILAIKKKMEELKATNEKLKKQNEALFYFYVFNQLAELQVRTLIRLRDDVARYQQILPVTVFYDTCYTCRAVWHEGTGPQLCEIRDEMFCDQCDTHKLLHNKEKKKDFSVRVIIFLSF